MFNSNFKVFGKLSFIFFLFLCSISLSSCSPDSQYATSSPMLNVVQEDSAMNELLDSIDALNAKYPSIQTRGAFLSGGLVGLADAAGWAAGGAVGRWAGGAAGSIGGPATAVLGAFVGGRVGPYVCTFLASGAANFACSRLSSRATLNEAKEFQLVSIISNEDSIGFYHNYMMTELNKNREKYVSSDSIDYNLIYEDIVKYLYEIGKYDEALKNPIVKNNIINHVKSICDISEKYKLNPNSDEFISAQCNYLRNKCFLQEEEVKSYRDFNIKLYKKCSALSDDQLKD